MTGRRARGLALVWGMLAAACAPPVLPPPVMGPGAVLDGGVFVSGDGTRLPLRRWVPAGEDGPVAVVVALHGFNDHAGAFETVGPALAARRIAVVAYDQRGFGGAPGRGRWPGGETLAADAREALKAARHAYPGVPVYLLGESMGGAVAVVALAGWETGESASSLADGVILSAPAVWARPTMPWYQQAALWVAVRVAPGLTLTGRGLKRYPSDNWAMMARLAQDPLWIRATRVDAMAGITDLMDSAHARADRLKGPVLMLYGLHDQIIPAPPVRAVAGRLADHPGFCLAVYPEGWHMLLRDRQAAVVLDDVAAWVREPGPAVPSGAGRRAPAFLSGALRAEPEQGRWDPPPADPRNP
ncbi:alpha/beta hydrolase [Pararhodospirillum oryzae]|uniref:Alpha/beta hydrolase n=1 Tax=Pararhodospirillum oryzae TaxID=478448 RepID=A0A512H691_9PROT|nr:alpha/beta hydrolase [Pararhodospirillum oryzae]GEO80979.1 alpha/beta hydrolase [Pararhodospirillum oryzae]